MRTCESTARRTPCAGKRDQNLQHREQTLQPHHRSLQKKGKKPRSNATNIHRPPVGHLRPSLTGPPVLASASAGVIWRAQNHRSKQRAGAQKKGMPHTFQDLLPRHLRPSLQGPPVLASASASVLWGGFGTKTRGICVRGHSTLAKPAALGSCCLPFSICHLLLLTSCSLLLPSLPLLLPACFCLLATCCEGG